MLLQLTGSLENFQITFQRFYKMNNNGHDMGAVPWYSRQLEQLNNMPVMGSSLEWTIPPQQGLTIRQRGNE